ncbi:MAG: glycoside hydrolase family 3 protein [Bacteroidales bacterium]|nr:glycoside hydrolase family 3 protein [Candidatus Sodaliphilus limicaballi]
MMKRITLALAIVLVAANSLFASLPADSVLRRQAARMLMVGFKGNTVDEGCDAYRYVHDLHVGCIVLFDVDLTGTAKLGSRNVTSKDQLKTLTSQLHRWADYPLLIAADQEGGRVARLKPQYGFKKVVSARYVGEVNNEDSTRCHARLLAGEMAECGVNLNLAPVVDLHNQNCSALGAIDRCYSSDPAVVARHAGWFVDESHKQGVACTLKHFPGHGNATADSHLGFVDVTSTYTQQELEPFKILIKQKRAPFMMTAHIINRNIDPDYPATLSRKFLTDILRKQLKYDGVVITDDLYMQAISNKYSIERAVVLAINAGADMLCASNNINTGFEADRPYKLIDIIVKAVKEGRIPYSRILEANRRIDRAARQVSHPTETKK